MKFFPIFVVLGAITFAGCVKQRTVTQDGRVVEQKPMLNRPVKSLIENSQ